MQSREGSFPRTLLYKFFLELADNATFSYFRSLRHTHVTFCLSFRDIRWWMLGRLVSSRFKNNRSEEEISSIRLGLSIGVYHKRVTRKTIACDEGWFSKRSSLERRVVARDTPFWQASDFTMRSRCIQVGEGEKMFVARGRPSNAPREFRKLQLHRQSDAWRFTSGVVKVGGWKGGCEEVEEDRCRGLGIVWILMCWNS